MIIINNKKNKNNKSLYFIMYLFSTIETINLFSNIYYLFDNIRIFIFLTIFLGYQVFFFKNLLRITDSSVVLHIYNQKLILIDQ